MNTVKRAGLQPERFAGGHGSTADYQPLVRGSSGSSGAEHHLAAVVDGDGVLGRKASLEDRLRERVLDLDWIARLSGRAPYTGSKPTLASSASAASEISNRSPSSRGGSQHVGWMRAIDDVLLAERVEHHDLVDPVHELGPEMVFTSAITASFTTW